MRVGLAVIRVTQDYGINVDSMVELIREAAREGADLVLFGEAAPTGLINNDDPTHDMAIAQPILGPTANTLAQGAKDAGVYVALGMLEKDGNCLYDSAILIDPEGQIILKYRRISPGWHGPTADSSVYRHGESIPLAETPLGSFAFLICGDLFDDVLVERVRTAGPDWLLLPFARCFDDGSYDQRRWDQEEKQEYADHAAKTGAVCMMVNYVAERELDGGSFGGAMIVGRDGSVLAEAPLGQPGLWLFDLRQALGDD